MQLWPDKWLMKLNPYICKVATKGKDENTPGFICDIRENKLKESTSIRDLEVNIMTNLSPKNHIRRSRRERNISVSVKRTFRYMDMMIKKTYVN